MDTSFKAAVIGAGAIGRSYLQILSSMEDVNLCAVVDPSPHAREVASTFGAAWYATTQEMLQTESIEFAIVSTPPVNHEAIIEMLLLAKVHVLCEKPFVLSSSVATRLTELAEEQRCALLLAAKFRYTPAIIAGRELLQRGELGSSLLLRNRFSSSLDLRHRWNGNPEVSGGGVLIDNGSHSVDIVQFLCGPVEAVRATVSRTDDTLAVEDIADLRLRCRNGAEAEIQLRWNAEAVEGPYLQIRGSRATLDVGWQQSHLRVLEEKRVLEWNLPYSKLDSLRGQIVDLLSVIRGAADARITTAEMIHSVRLIEAAYASSSSGREVTL